MALAITKDSLKETLSADKAGAALTRLQNMQVFRQLGTLLLIAGAMAVGLMVFFWSQKPNYSPLYTGLDAKATVEATDLLRASSIPFQLDQATGAISVPEANLHDARLKLAASGLTDSGGRLGFELMERDPGFGVSQFVENARYQHALETELVRTITTLRPVRDARVHLAMPKPSAFTRQREAASASVVLDLRSGTLLERNQVDAIVHLVASSIPDLAPERVTVVDQSGRMLTVTDPDSEAALNAAQFERVRKLETSYNQRIRELLEPLTGPGRVNAEVAVDMDFSVSEEARETFNNDPAKIRSEQVSQNTVSKPGPEGIPGATSNTPPGAPAAAANPDAPVETASSATRNFEMDRTLQHTRQPAGRLRRVTVAVLVDHLPRPGADGKVTMVPMDAATLSRVESLVREAVGFDAARGDSVSVMNAPFVREPDAAAEDAPIWQHPILHNPMVRDIARWTLGALVALALLFGVLRPAIRQIVQPRALPRPAPPNAEVTLLDQDDDEAALAALRDQAHAPQHHALPSDAYEDRLRNAREAVKHDSKQVAQVVKDWVASDE